MNRYKLFKAGIDVNIALERLDNDKVLYEQLLHDFVADPSFKALEEAIAQKNAQEAYIAAHAMKGTAGNLSCITLYGALLPLVDSLRVNDMADAEEMFAKVKEAWQAMTAAVEG